MGWAHFEPKYCYMTLYNEECCEKQQEEENGYKC